MTEGWRGNNEDVRLNAKVELWGNKPLKIGYDPHLIHTNTDSVPSDIHLLVTLTYINTE